MRSRRSPGPPARCGAGLVPRLSRARQHLHADEAGNGPISSIAGVAIFLGFLLLAAQTTIHLYGVSTSTALLFDEARRVAAEGSYTCNQAEGSLTDRLGDWGSRFTLVDCVGDTDPGADQIRFRVRGPSPANLVAGFGAATGFDTFTRTVHVTKEAFQP